MPSPQSRPTRLDPFTNMLNLLEAVIADDETTDEGTNRAAVTARIGQGETLLCLTRINIDLYSVQFFLEKSGVEEDELELIAQASYRRHHTEPSH